MFLKIVDTIAEWVGPVLVLLGIGAWFAGQAPHAFPAGALMPIGGAVFSVLALFAAREEKKKLNMIVSAGAIAIGALWAAYVYFSAGG